MIGPERLWSGCGQCDGHQQCPLAEGSESVPDGTGPGEVRGSHLVVPAMAAFIVPPLVAIGGAYVAGQWWAGASSASLGRWQATGAMAGSLIGVGLGRLLLTGVSSLRASTDGTVPHDR